MLSNHVLVLSSLQYNEQRQPEKRHLHYSNTAPSVAEKMSILATRLHISIAIDRDEFGIVGDWLKNSIVRL